MVRAARWVSTLLALELRRNLPADLVEEKGLDDGLRVRENYYLVSELLPAYVQSNFLAFIAGAKLRKQFGRILCYDTPMKSKKKIRREGSCPPKSSTKGEKFRSL